MQCVLSDTRPATCFTLTWLTGPYNVCVSIVKLGTHTYTPALLSLVERNDFEQFNSKLIRRLMTSLQDWHETQVIKSTLQCWPEYHLVRRSIAFSRSHIFLSWHKVCSPPVLISMLTLPLMSSVLFIEGWYDITLQYNTTYIVLYSLL